MLGIQHVSGVVTALQALQSSLSPSRGRGVGPPPPPPRGALVRGAPVRGAIARGAAVARGVPPPPAVRGAPAPRARAAGIQRIPLPPPPAPETYEEYVRNCLLLFFIPAIWLYIRYLTSFKCRLPTQKLALTK